MTAGITAAAVATTALSAVGSIAASTISGAISGGGGGGSGAAPATGGGSGIQSNESNFYKSNASNPFYGVNVSSKVDQSSTPPKNPEMPVNGGEVSRGRVSTARETPTQPDGTQDAKQDINNEWADRLSKYLDYNTRALG